MWFGNMSDSRLFQKYCILGATLLLVGGVMWILNILSPRYVDDYWYGYMYTGDYFDINRPITSFGDVMISQYHHYFGFNGRSVVHTIVQSVLGFWGKEVFSIVNAAAFVLFIWLLTRFSGSICVRNLLFSAAAVLLFYPEFNLTILWTTGAVNYLWTSIAVCLFLMIFERLRTEPFRLSHVVWFLPGLLIGWTHEGITFPMAVSLGIYAVLNRKTFCRSAVAPLVLGFFVGALICVCAPGTFARIGMSENFLAMVSSKILCGIRLSSCLKAFWLFVCTLLIRWATDKANFYVWLRGFYEKNMVLWHTMILSFGVVFISGLNAARAGIGVELPALMLWMRLVGLWECRVVTSLIKSLCCVAGGVLSLFVLYYSVGNYRDYKNMMAQIEQEESDIVLMPTLCYPRFLKSYIINYEYAFNPWRRWNWINELYHCENKAFVPVMIYDDILQDSDRVHDIGKQKQWPCYVIPIEGDPDDVTATFILRPTDYAALPFYLRPFAPQFARYAATEMPIEQYAVTHIGGKSYVLVPKHELLENRIIDIVVK